ncbi:MAG: GtrA family protein [Bacteroidales bacterium]|nr:GtrA family protein [Bacteroidales bacterium]MBO5854181.1 GtrA family protein [Bacteroidales bacterium]
MRSLLIIDKLLISKFIKFGVVGCSGMIIDFGTTYLCKEKLRLNKYLSNCIGFILAATSNYFLNRIWTFESHKEEIAVQYMQFMVVSTIGLGINSLVLYLLADKLKWNFYFSKLIAIATTTIWNFFANMLFTFA